MFRITLLLLLSLFCDFSFGQTTLSTDQWREDVRFLQQTVHDSYSFLFKKISQEDWDAQVEELYQAIPEMQPHEVVAGIGRLVAAFGWGHTDIGLKGILVEFNRVPLNLYWFKDGIYVEGSHKDYESLLGARILKVEGVDVLDALDAVKPLTPVENEQFFKAYGIDFLLVPEALHAQRVTGELKKTVTLTAEKNGEVKDYTLDARPGLDFPRQYSLTKAGGDWVSVRDQGETPHYLRHLDKIYYWEYLPEYKTVYVRHSQIQDEADEPVPVFYSKIFDFIEKNDVERLVLDVRLNGGGNNYKNKPVVKGVVRCEKIDQTGKFYVIIGRRTFSACQNLVNELSNYTNAVFVGEPTSENLNFYGDNNRIELPHSKIPVYLSFAWWQDKPQWENKEWMAPHVPVEMTFDEYRTNQDPVLDAALSFSAENFVLDPMRHFTELFTTGQIERLKSDAASMVKDPRYVFFDFEKEFNKVGYRLLGQNQMEPALFVFQMTTELFPESPNAWNSLAEALWKAGQKEQASALYNKVIQMDPDGPSGEHARTMLKKIASE